MPKPATGLVRLTPVTWWTIGISIAWLAGMAYSVPFLASLVLSAALGILVLAPTETRIGTLRLYGTMAALVILVRVAFRIVFNVPSFENTALHLPLIEFQVFGAAVTMLGPVSSASLVAGLTDGLRLAAIILGIGFSASVANPRKLIRSAPSVLYEFATAAAIAINLAPQLIFSLNRIRRARSLRGSSSGLRNLHGLLIPLLEDTLQRSLELAASMDARGFGRRGPMRIRAIYATRVAAATGTILLGVFCYLLLATTYPIWIPVAIGLLALACLAVSAKLAGLHRVRTRLVLVPTTTLDWMVRLACTAAVLILATTSLHPNLTQFWGGK